jgi:putative ABC transport system permease protein
LSAQKVLAPAWWGAATIATRVGGRDDASMMAGLSPALVRVRSDGRARRVTWVLAVVVVGVLGGGLLATVAAARRTSTAYDRLRQSSAAPDLVVTPAPCPEEEDQEKCRTSSGVALRSLSDVPGVRGAASFNLYSGVFSMAGGRVLQPECETGSGEMGVLSPLGKPFGVPVQRPVVIEGRAADPGRFDEVVVGVSTRDVGVRVGDTIEADVGEFCPEEGSPRRTRVDLHVVGVVADTMGVRPEFGQYVRTVYATAAFATWATAHDLAERPLAFVRLDPGTTAGSVIGSGGPLSVAFSADQQREAMQRSIWPDTLVLLLIAGLGTALVLLVVAPAMVRAERNVLRDATLLRTIGFTRADLRRIGFLYGVAVAVPAAVLAVLFAVFLSPLAPAGDAASFEPDPGLSADWTVLAPGAIAIVLVTVLLTTITAGVRPRTLASGGRRPLGSRLADGLHVTPTGRLGVRFAFDAVTGRPATGAARLTTQVLGVAAVAGALMFVGSLTVLRSTPRLIGWNWDAAVFGSDRTEDLAAALRSTPGVERISVGTFFSPGPEGLLLGERRVPSWVVSLETGPSSVPFSVIDGRTPTADHELLVHPDLLRRLGVHVGDTTTVRLQERFGGATSELTIVGTGVLPLDAQQFKSAAGMTYRGLSALLPDGGADEVRPEIITFDVAGSLDLGSLRQRLADSGLIEAADLVTGDVRLGSDLVAGLTVDDVDSVPRVLAVLAAVLAGGVLANLIVARRREWSHELAVHRALGFTASQTRRAVVAGAALLALSAAAIGIPIGVVAGRLAWLTYAADLGVKPEAAIPWPWLGIVLVASVGIGATAGYVSGWVVTRRGLTQTLRAE